MIRVGGVEAMVTDARMASPEGSDEEVVTAPAQEGLTMISCPPAEWRSPPWLPLRL